MEFFDFQCPFCKKAQPAVKAIEKKYSRKVSIIHENFPLPSHRLAFPAAVAAECARRQGSYIAYHDSLFANQERLALISYDSLAIRIGIKDQNSFNQCVENQKPAKLIIASKKLAHNLHINSIPIFLINGQKVVGALPKKQLSIIVQNTLDKVNGE